MVFDNTPRPLSVPLISAAIGVVNLLPLVVDFPLMLSNTALGAVSKGVLSLNYSLHFVMLLWFIKMFCAGNRRGMYLITAILITNIFYFIYLLAKAASIKETHLFADNQWTLSFLVISALAVPLILSDRTQKYFRAPSVPTIIHFLRVIAHQSACMTEISVTEKNELSSSSAD